MQKPGNKIYLLRHYTAAFLFFILATCCYASALAQGIEPGVTSNNFGILGGASAATHPLIANSSIPLGCPAPTATEDLPGNPAIIKNTITFSLWEEGGYVIPQGFYAKINIDVQTGVDEASATAATATNQDIVVGYESATAKTFNARRYITFTGAKFVIVTVKTISAFIFNGTTPQPVTQLPGTSIDVAKILWLENAMQVTYFYTLKNNISPTRFNVPANANPLHTDPAPDELFVSWQWPQDGGNNYTELEWTWLDDEMKGLYTVNNNLDLAQLFQNNATRVDVPLNGINYAETGPGYKIPLLYDNAGSLYCRIRAINVLPGGSKTVGPWCTTNVTGNTPGDVAAATFTGHNNDLNWQVTTSYAEEGKRKTVIQYYDGSLRGRQTVTKDNSTNTVVTAETFYDLQGRPTIQILPAPGTGNVIAYTQNLNLFDRAINLNIPDAQAAGTDPAQIFDLVAVNPAIPAAVPNPLDALPGLATQNGTSLYYSAANTEKNTESNTNIPDAGGFPYTLTRYTPDATGRVLAQSGVGTAMQMGSGHETTYYYGKPTQGELDGLFGSEVGVATHYFKNMVVDANGQASVSYTDMHGRTIATALAGNAPANVAALDKNNDEDYLNQHGTPITSDLLTNGANVIKNNTVEAISTVLVSAKNTQLTLTYSLDGGALPMNNCDATTQPNSYNYTYTYDLEIQVINEATGVAAPLQVPGNSTPQDKLMFTGITSESQVTFIANASDVGSYSVRKTLTLRQDAAQQALQTYLTPGRGLCTTLEKAVSNAISAAKTSSGCAEPGYTGNNFCLELSKGESNYITNYYKQLGITTLPADVSAAEAAYQAAVAHCGAFDQTVSHRLEDIKDAMLADMSPYGGQYATRAYDPQNPTTPGVRVNPVDGSIFTGDVVGNTGGTMFNTYNIFANGDYKTPSSELNTPGQINYVNASGIADPTINNILTTVTPDDFTRLFKDPWAQGLLPYHPEYQKLKFASNPANHITDAYNWIDGGAFAQASTWQQAVNAGLLNAASDITYQDPYFNSVNPGGGDRGIMQGYIKTNWQDHGGAQISMWQLAYGNVACVNKPDQASRNSCYENAPAYPLLTPGDVSVTPALLAGQEDMVWSNFKGFYQTARDALLNSYIDNQQPVSNDAALISQGFILHFPKSVDQAVQQTGGSTTSPTAAGSQWYTPATSTTPVQPNTTGSNNVNQQAGLQNANIVTGYTAMWKSELLQNAAIAALPTSVPGQTGVNPQQNLIDRIIGDVSAGTGFAGVCLNAIDAAHPNGATDATTPNANGETSFEQVFAHAVQWYNTTYPPTPPAQALSSNSLTCNVYVIQYPKGSNNNNTATGQLITQVNNCTCTQYQTLLIQAGSAALDAHGAVSLTLLNNWLQANNYQTITQGLFDGLGQCGNLPQIDLSGGGGGSGSNLTGNGGGGGSQLYNAYTLPQAEPLPPYLVCGYTGNQQCLTCSRLNNYNTIFLGLFPLPGATPAYTALPLKPATGNTLSNTDVQYNRVYQNYLNYQTGFQLTWLDYQAAISSSACSNTVCAPGSAPDYIDVYIDAHDQPAGGYEARDSVMFYEGFTYTEDSAQLTAIIDPTLAACNGGGQASVLCPATGSTALNDPTDLVQPPIPCQQTADMAAASATQNYQNTVDEKTADFARQYAAGGLAVHEAFTVSYTTGEYHYTLYYYDMAGSLVKTVPPKGVRPDFSNSVTIESDKQQGISDPMPHTLVTNYRYNSLGQVVAQQTPDAGISSYWYDALGRLVISQNAKQAVADANGDKRYSYTLFDPLGRITEVGQKPQTAAIGQDITQDDGLLANWLSADGSTTTANNKEQITRTTYDVPYIPVNGDITATDFAGYISQQNLRNRVSYVEVFDKEPHLDGSGNLTTSSYHATATYYTYDIHGNVNLLLQDYGSSAGTGNVMNQHSNRFKVMAYDYDLVSGKVNKVSYQPGYADAVYHRYSYDAENRLTDVETSRDDIYYEHDAAYSYYKHGPLAQTMLGQLNVQQLNYTYTIQGWLKSVNAGWDGSTAIAGTGNAAAPAYGFSLHYFSGDYRAIGQAAGTPTTDVIFNGIGGIEGTGDGQLRPLYNGNIAAMAVNIPQLAVSNTGATGKPMVYHYGYDQLNRLVGMDAFSSTDNTFASLTKLQEYHEEATYDPNGNIIKYLRNGTGSSPAMDNLTYKYEVDPLTNKPASNKLRYVYDGVTGNTGTDDIKSQTSLATQAAVDGDINTLNNNDNYGYDAIGNLIKNAKENITNIDWTVYGKISSITKTVSGVTTTINYTYDVAGNRISKAVKVGTATPTTTWYVRDASGNVMSIYTADPTVSSGHLTQAEIPLYGSSRLGEIKPNTDLITYAPNTVTLADGSTAIASSFIRGQKLFELSNHLGNVLVTISDKKIPTADANSNGIVDGTEAYTADVVTAQDYYPGGMVEPGRQYPVGNSAGYRYGFNGKENDNDIEAGAQDYGARIYDSRTERWYSSDFDTKAYLSPYVFAKDCPSNLVDPDGNTEYHFHYITETVTRPALQKTADGHLYVKDVQQTITFKFLEIRPDNLPPTFFVHRDVLKNGKTTENVPVQFFPDKAGSATGVTTTIWSLPFFTITTKDDDLIALEKITDDFSGIREKVQSSIVFAPGADLGPDRKFWDHFYSSKDWHREQEKTHEEINSVMLGIIGGEGLDILMAGGGLLGLISDAVDLKTISNIRATFKIGKDRNIAFAIGEIDGEAVGVIGTSGPHTFFEDAAGNVTDPIFKTCKAGDSEYKILEDIAKKYQGNPNVSGNIRLVSERTFCTDCAGAIDQFRAKFPNINIDGYSGGTFKPNLK